VVRVRVRVEVQVVRIRVRVGVKGLQLGLVVRTRVGIRARIIVS
jgi:hypothetical protein